MHSHVLHVVQRMSEADAFSKSLPSAASAVVAVHRCPLPGDRVSKVAYVPASVCDQPLGEAVL